MSPIQNLYISFIGEKFEEQDVRKIFEEKGIGLIENIIFFDHNFKLGINGEWGREAIIYMRHWELNDYTRALNFMMYSQTTSFIQIDETTNWEIQKYGSSLNDEFV